MTMKDSLIIGKGGKPTPPPAPEPKPELPVEEIIQRCSLRPMGPQIVVLRDPVLEKTKGGLFLPPTGPQAKRKVTRGTVVRVGPGGWDPQGGRRKIDLGPGDRVVFGEFTGIDIDHPEPWGEQTYTLMQEAEILAGIDRPSSRKVIRVGRMGAEEEVRWQDIRKGDHFKIVADDPDDHMHDHGHIVHEATSHGYQAEGVWTVDSRPVGEQREGL